MRRASRGRAFRHSWMVLRGLRPPRREENDDGMLRWGVLSGGASFQAFLGGSAQVLAGFPKSRQKLFESNAPIMSTPQFESQSGTCSTPCGILRRRASMEVKCPDGIGRECWVWVVPCTGSWPGQPPPTKVGEGALSAVCPPAGPNLRAAQ